MRQIKIISTILVMTLIIGNLTGINVQAKTVEMKNETNVTVKNVNLYDKETTEQGIVQMAEETGAGEITIADLMEEVEAGEILETTQPEEEAGAILTTSQAEANEEEDSTTAICEETTVVWTTEWVGNPEASETQTTRSETQTTRNQERPTKPSEWTTKQPTNGAINNHIPKETTASYTSAANISTAHAVILNYDFSINKKGKARAMTFASASYKNTYKVKITITIQKKKRGKWKKYKKYRVTKNSNLAYFNKNFTIKKNEIYRMKAEVKFYRKGEKPQIYIKKSKKQKYRRSR